METIARIGQVCSCVTTVVAAAVLLIRPLRYALSGTRDLCQGQKCLLRSTMLHTYYKGREAQSLRQYEYENFLLAYKAYKALGGNSFIDHIAQEISTWHIMT